MKILNPSSSLIILLAICFSMDQAKACNEFLSHKVNVKKISKSGKHSIKGRLVTKFKSSNWDAGLSKESFDMFIEGGKYSALVSRETGGQYTRRNVYYLVEKKTGKREELVELNNFLKENNLSSFIDSVQIKDGRRSFLFVTFGDYIAKINLGTKAKKLDVLAGVSPDRTYSSPRHYIRQYQKFVVEKPFVNSGKYRPAGELLTWDNGGTDSILSLGRKIGVYKDPQGQKHILIRTLVGDIFAVNYDTGTKTIVISSKSNRPMYSLSSEVKIVNDGFNNKIIFYNDSLGNGKAIYTYNLDTKKRKLIKKLKNSIEEGLTTFTRNGEVYVVYSEAGDLVAGSLKLINIKSSKIISFTDIAKFSMESKPLVFKSNDQYYSVVSNYDGIYTVDLFNGKVISSFKPANAFYDNAKIINVGDKTYSVIVEGDREKSVIYLLDSMTNAIVASTKLIKHPNKHVSIENIRVAANKRNLVIDAQTSEGIFQFNFSK